jgi:hypothetical protein
MGRPKGSRNAPRVAVKLADAPAPKAKAAHLSVVKHDDHQTTITSESATAPVEALEREEPAPDLHATLDAPVPTMIFERNETGVITLSEAAKAYRTLCVNEPVVATIDGDEVLLLPSGHVLMHHPDGNASCAVEGRSYSFGTDGALMVPDHLEDALTTHGFKRL